MNWRLKLIDFQHRIFSSHHNYILHEEESEFKKIKIKYQPKINFLGMFSNNKFMAGYNTRTNLPWNSPFFIYDFYLKNPKEFLFLGGGPCCAPTALWRRDRRKKISIEVIENDPITIKLAHTYFNLPYKRRYKIYNQQAETFLQITEKKYDVIFFDLGFSYHRRNDPRYQFCIQTKNLVRLNNLLTQQGLVIFVLIANRNQIQKEFLSRMINKFRKIFKTCDIFADLPSEDQATQSHIFILSQNSHLNLNQMKKLTSRNGHWGKLYKELKNKKLMPQFLTSN